MIIDQSIIDRAGRILIARNTVLDAYHIMSLLKMGVPGIYIREGEEDAVPVLTDNQEPIIEEAVKNKIDKNTIQDRAKVKLSESVKARVAEGIQYLYNDTSSDNFTSTTKNITDDLMRAITDNDAVAVDISALKISDEYTFKHSVDVATIAMILAKQQGLSKKQIYDIGVAGLLHDVGKTKVPLDILNKPGRLDESEFAIMKQHSVFGYRMIKDRGEFDEEICLAVLQHHEKINGKGYPVGFSEQQITPYAKLLSVADIYDALVTERPYKKAFSQRDAVEMIMSMTEELDMDAMHTFLESMILYPVDSVVELSNGELAKVVKNNPHYILRPTVVGITSGKVYNLGEDLACNNIIII
jgi:putative nucleotidyltransferase with HDIG domain